MASAIRSTPLFLNEHATPPTATAAINRPNFTREWRTKRHDNTG